MANIGYLVAAYLILWLGIFGYLFWMGGSLRGVRSELNDLRQAVNEREAEAVAERVPVEAPVETPVELRGR